MKKRSRIALSLLLIGSLSSINTLTHEPTPTQFCWTSFKGTCPVKGLTLKSSIKRLWPYLGLYAFIHFITHNSTAPQKDSTPHHQTQVSQKSTTTAQQEKLNETVFSKTQGEILKIIAAVFFTDLIKQDIKDLQGYFSALYEEYFPTVTLV